MQIRCPSCRRATEISADLHGATIRCAECGANFTAEADAGEPVIPVVVAVDAPPLQNRLQVQPVLAVPPRLRPEVSQATKATRKPNGSGWMIVAGIVLVGLFLFGSAAVGGLTWWLMRGSASAPSAVSNVAATGISQTATAAPEPDRPRRRSAPDGQLSQEMLDHLKALTALVQVEAGNQRGSGSGFLIKADGDTGYFITNAHVVTPEPQDDGGGDLPLLPRFPQIMGPGALLDPPGFPQIGPPRFPQFPALPMLPPIFERLITPQAVTAKVRLVLDSGTRAERVVPAEVIDTDEVRDLALLRISATKLPTPIDLANRAELKETKPVFTVGYPFGEMLGLKGNPEVSIGKATITSVRRDKTDKIALVQLQGDFNPGNSGGPVVDADGRLAGIAVAHIKGTQIGLALAPEMLEEMLHRGKASMKLNVVNRERERCEVEFVVDVLDIFDSLAEVRLLYAPGWLAPPQPQEQSDGGYAELPKSRTLKLTAEGKRYSGRLTVLTKELKGDQLPVQLVYVQRDGKTHHGQPRSHFIAFEGHQPTPDNPFPGGLFVARGIEVGLSSGRFFHIRMREPGLEIFAQGEVKAGLPSPDSIRIVDNDETIKADNLDKLPEKYRARVQALLASKQLQDMIHPPPKVGAPPAGNESETLPPITNIFAGGQCVYLSDLKEYAVKNGPWPFAKDGTIGAPENHRIQVGGKESPHGIGMHPPENPKIASAKYRLGKQAALFKATVAIDDSTDFCFTPAVFTVWGDGKQLFESKYISHIHSRALGCSVDVSGVDILEIRVHAVGVNSGVHAVWVEPRLLQHAETADPAIPAPLKLFERGPREFLSDLAEMETKLGPWALGKNGTDGNNEAIAVNGKKSPKGLGLHPPKEGSASVSYRIGKKAALFKGGVAFNDHAFAPAGPVVFEIHGDGKQLWRSQALRKQGVEEQFNVAVSGVDVLELRVIAEGDNFALHAVWIEPRLLQKSDTPDK